MVCVDRNAVNLDYNENNTKQSKRIRYDIRDSEVGIYNQLLAGRQFGADKLDCDFVTFLSLVCKSSEQKKSLSDEVAGDEDEDEDEDDVDKDPEYNMFLKELRENHKSRSFEVCGYVEVPGCLEREQLDEYESPTNVDINVGNDRRSKSSSEDMSDSKTNQQEECLFNSMLQARMRTRSSKQKKRMKRTSTIEYKQNTTGDTCYQKFLNGNIGSTDSSFMYKGKRMDYGNSVTRDDPEVVVLDDLQNCGAGNHNLLFSAEKDPSADLTEELVRILRQPYDRKEYERLFEYVNEQRVVCHHKDLRDRGVSFPVDGSTKSLLNDYRDFDKILRAAEDEHDRPIALNLLRGFRFWLEHLPNEGMFKPWLDKELRKIRPKSKLLDQ